MLSEVEVEKHSSDEVFDSFQSPYGDNALRSGERFKKGNVEFEYGFSPLTGIMLSEEQGLETA